MKKLILLVLLFAGIATAQQPSLNWRGSLTASCSNASTTCTGTVGSTVENTGGFNTTNFQQDLSGFGLATVTVSGTYAGVTINFEFSDDGGVTWFSEQCTRTDVNIQEASEVLPSNQVRAWDCGLSGPTKLRVRASAYGSGTVVVGVTATVSAIEPAPTVAQTNTPGQTDPCQSPSAMKSSIFKNISSATTTAVIASSGTTKIYICGFNVVMTGTTSPDTILLEDGTGATCVTTQVPLTPTYSSGTLTSGATAFTVGYGGSTVTTTAAGGEICAVSTVATSPTISLFITYVQQ